MRHSRREMISLREIKKRRQEMKKLERNMRLGDFRK
jgi:t-SNARE complex subunit (syntaxin)